MDGLLGSQVDAVSCYDHARARAVRLCQGEPVISATAMVAMSMMVRKHDLLLCECIVSKIMACKPVVEVGNEKLNEYNNN